MSKPKTWDFDDKMGIIFALTEEEIAANPTNGGLWPHDVKASVKMHQLLKQNPTTISLRMEPE